MNGFTFFRNYYEAINDPDSALSDKDMGRLYNAIFSYMFDGKIPELKGPIKSIFKIMQVSLDRSKRNGINREKNENGMKTESKQSEYEMENEWNENEKNTVSNERPFFEKEEVGNTKIRNTSESKKVSNKKTDLSSARKSYARESYDEIMLRWECGPVLQAALGAYLQHCSANKKVVTNQRFNDLICSLYDRFGAGNEDEMSDSIYRAIQGGFYDVR